MWAVRLAKLAVALSPVQQLKWVGRTTQNLLRTVIAKAAAGRTVREQLAMLAAIAADRMDLAEVPQSFGCLDAVRETRFALEVALAAVAAAAAAAAAVVVVVVAAAAVVVAAVAAAVAVAEPAAAAAVAAYESVPCIAVPIPSSRWLNSLHQFPQKP